MKLSALIFTVFCWMICGKVFAQRIKPDDVLKIGLVEKDGGASSDESRFLIVRKNGVWKSYRTKRVKSWDPKTRNMAVDSSTLFIKNIPVSLLTELLAVLANPDTGIVAGHFTLNKDSLIKYTDTLHPALTPQQKAAFVNTLKSKNDIHDALVYVSPILQGSGGAHYDINIVARTEKIYTFRRQKLWGLSYSPWLNTDSVKNYNPRIQNIFYQLSGVEARIIADMKQLYINIDKYLYRKYFETQFNWELYQRMNPASYSILNNTIIPVKFIMDRHKPNQPPDYRETYVIHSSRLPDYVNIYWDFKKTDTENSLQLKRYEDTLARIFNRGNFLFDYLNTRKGARLFMVKYRADGMDNLKKHASPILDKIFPGFADMRHIQFLRLVEADGNMSEWMLLENGNLILEAYTGELNDGAKTEFKGITPDPKSTGSHKHLKHLCLLFSDVGKRIGGTEEKVIMNAPY